MPTSMRSFDGPQKPASYRMRSAPSRASKKFNRAVSKFEPLRTCVEDGSLPSTELLSTDASSRFSAINSSEIDQLQSASFNDESEEQVSSVMRSKNGNMGTQRGISSSNLAATKKSRGSLMYYQPRSSSMMNRSSRRALDEMTIDKLQLSRLSLYGRSTETKIMKECWERVLAPKDEAADVSREFVLVSGYSGTGKSALVRQLEKPVEECGFFAFGKFDSQKRGEPYYGVASACHELCLAISTIQNRRGEIGNIAAEDISNKIKAELGDDVKVLTKILPILKDVLGFDRTVTEDKSSPSNDDGLGMLEERNRFNYAFRRFLRVVASFGPVVLVLDDMQWSDVASMDLLQYIIEDTKNKHLMVIGLYRSNEVDDGHLLTKMIRDIEHTSEQQGVNVTKFELGNLSVSNVVELLDDLLYTESKQSKGLAEIIHRKTSGNVFFVIQFLLALNTHDLLTYDFGQTKWRWDEKNIEEWTAATANVVDLMKEKLNKLDPEVRRKLPIMAFLGADFKTRLLSLLFESFDREMENEEAFEDKMGNATRGQAAIEMMNFLETCTKEGIIEASGSDGHRWIHDKIQEASLSLLSEEKLKKSRLVVGQILKRKLFGEEVEENLFLIVNLFTETAELVPEGDDFRVEAAKFFLRAGKKAFSSSAFRQAGFYFAKAMELLPAGHWTDQYKLSLDLYSSAAEAEYAVANIEIMEKYCSAVMENATALQDKFRCNLLLVEGPARRNDLKSAIDMTLKILSQLGCKFPVNFLHGPTAIKRLLGWKSRLKNQITAEQIGKLEPMTDIKRIFCMNLLEKLDPFCYISGNLPLFIMVVLKRIEWTIKHGYCLHSASAFSSIGIVYTGAVGDIQLGELCARHCLSLQDKVGSRAIESGNYLRCYGLNLHYTTPLITCQKGLLSGFQVGLEMGDLTSALFSVYQYLELCRASGKSLDVLESDYLTYVKQMKETHQLQALEWSLVEYQGVLNLRGKSENTVILTGEVMDQKEVLSTVEQTKNLTLRYLVRRKQMYLATFLDEHEFGADLAIEFGEAALQSLAGSNGAISQCFLSALSCISAYKKTRRNKYKKAAKAMTGRIQDWIKKGNPNIGHYGVLLDAEWNTMRKGKQSEAVSSYLKANTIAARFGFIHDRALINERHGEYMLELGTDNDEAEYRLKEATKLYIEWGADRKVDLLSKKYGDQFPNLAPREKSMSQRNLEMHGYK